MSTSKSEQSWFSRARIETLSDGVFAIVMTLLILEIKVPHIDHPDSVEELTQALSAATPKLLSWVLSFLLVFVIWVNHHRLFAYVGRMTHGIFWINTFLLLVTSFIPFPTAMIGDYPNNPMAISFFGFVLSLTAGSFILVRIVMLRYNLLVEDVDRALFRKATLRSFIFGPFLYLLSAALAWVNTNVSLVMYFLIPLYFILFNITTKYNKTEEVK